MLFASKPLKVSFKKLDPAKIVNVKDLERELRVDITGTWLYRLNTELQDMNFRIYFRTRYVAGTNVVNQSKEDFDSFRKLIPEFSVENNLFMYDLGSALENIVFVHIKKLPNGNKLYVVKFVTKDTKNTEAEGYLVFEKRTTMQSFELKKINNAIKRINKAIK